jgi:hypothetical protein
MDKNNGKVQELQAEQLVRIKKIALLFSEVNRYDSELLVRKSNCKHSYWCGK